ncbi:MAG: hypothetical protein GY842_25800 [bacterium]|nr:hypothetical protein [bacterium]
MQAFQDHVERILKEDPALPTVEILSHLRGLGCTSGKSAVYELVKTIRPPKTESPSLGRRLGHTALTRNDEPCDRNSRVAVLPTPTFCTLMRELSPSGLRAGWGTLSFLRIQSGQTGVHLRETEHERAAHSGRLCELTGGAMIHFGLS